MKALYNKPTAFSTASLSSQDGPDLAIAHHGEESLLTVGSPVLINTPVE
ncbi:MAG: hypothetical protein AAFY72_03065 [Cyanobacteria bacterium J06649_4]